MQGPSIPIPISPSRLKRSIDKSTLLNGSRSNTGDLDISRGGVFTSSKGGGGGSDEGSSPDAAAGAGKRGGPHCEMNRDEGHGNGTTDANAVGEESHPYFTTMIVEGIGTLEEHDG
ncbi:BgTH12-01791 [Blumeria graminis f. sp. triticale]|uniref:BgtAc-31358 n=3 Tax=Blumeria graminis TaxID=34373 RepID=A0A9X9MFD3_BLUGR|nr:hypothetical protein BGT96224_Ac31358 [Blumeria graminis f. sp. tritici 96224]CAD6501539.1 BgTH12-01791 [Blumeria graminis f. sp. triticale]VDB84089.1 BgtAc-31358 [Blumeria graminis f. sp. tritici]